MRCSRVGRWEGGVKPTVLIMIAREVALIICSADDLSGLFVKRSVYRQDYNRNFLRTG